jgi:hypothetical protein
MSLAVKIVYKRPDGAARGLTPRDDPFLWLALWMRRCTQLDAGLRRFIVNRVTVLVFEAHAAHCGTKCWLPYLCPYCKEFGTIVRASAIYYPDGRGPCDSFHWFFRQITAGQGWFQHVAVAIIPDLPDTPAYLPASPDFGPTSPNYAAASKRLRLDLGDDELDGAE